MVNCMFNFFKKPYKTKKEQWNDSRLFGCHRPVCGVLSNNKVLVTYREQSHLINKNNWARNTFSAVLNPYVKNRILKFDDGIILPLCHDDSLKSDSGYTGWVEYELGKVFIVNYLTGSLKKPGIFGYCLNV